MWLGLGQGHLSQGWPSDWSLWPWFLPFSCKLRVFEIPLMARPSTSLDGRREKVLGQSSPSLKDCERLGSDPRDLKFTSY